MVLEVGVVGLVSRLRVQKLGIDPSPLFHSVFPHVFKQLPSLTSIDLVMSSMDRPWIAPPTRAVILVMAVGVHVTLEYFRGFRFQTWFLAICCLDLWISIFTIKWQAKEPLSH